MRVATALMVALWTAGCIVTTDDNLWKGQDAALDLDRIEMKAANEGSVSGEGQVDGMQADVKPWDGPSFETSQPDLDPQKLANGSTCSLPSECASGHCVDLICCDTSCGGVCEACDVPNKQGACSLFESGTDPDDECALQPASTCGKDGFCDGKGGCRLYAAGTICGSSTCVGNDTHVEQCDGNGSCVNGPVTSCLPYKCNPSTGACYTSCSSDAQCVAYRCSWLTSKCRSTCSSDYHCQSGYSCKGGKCTN